MISKIKENIKNKLTLTKIMLLKNNFRILLLLLNNGYLTKFNCIKIFYKSRMTKIKKSINYIIQFNCFRWCLKRFGHSILTFSRIKIWIKLIANIKYRNKINFLSRYTNLKKYWSNSLIIILSLIKNIIQK